MDLSPFKLDIDELINEFAEKELRTLADMKKIWLRRKFSYIFEAQLPTNLALFMQTLYSHSLGHLISNISMSHRVGSLYCLYCLYETQPFKPPFKIYIFLGALQRLRALVVDAKEIGIRTVPAIVKRMLENNMFLFGSVDIEDYSKKDSVKELVKLQNACIKTMREKLKTDKDIEPFLHMDLGMELDLEVLTKISADYATSKSLAIEEAGKVLDVEDIKHLAEDRPTIGNEVAIINEEWSNHRELISHLTASEQHSAVNQNTQSEQLMLLPGTNTAQELGDEDIQEDGLEEDDLLFINDLENTLDENL